MVPSPEQARFGKASFLTPEKLGKASFLCVFFHGKVQISRDCPLEIQLSFGKPLKIRNFSYICRTDEFSMPNDMKKNYLAPAVRVGGLALERSFLTSATVGGIVPGGDPGTGGSWEFGDED